MTPRSTNTPGSCPPRRIRRLAKGLMTNTPKKVAAYGNPKEKACKEALGSHTVCLQHPHQQHHFEQSGELYDFTWLHQCCRISWDGKKQVSQNTTICEGCSCCSWVDPHDIRPRLKAVRSTLEQPKHLDPPSGPIWYLKRAEEMNHKTRSCHQTYYQWSFLVPLIGGRWYIIPQLAVYTTYIYHLPPIKGTRNSCWY